MTCARIDYYSERQLSFALGPGLNCWRTKEYLPAIHACHGSGLEDIKSVTLSYTQLDFTVAKQRT